METDCAAILPTPQQSYVSPAPVSIQTNQRTALRSGYMRPVMGATTVLVDRPPVEISETVYPQFCRFQERHATFQNWPLGEHFHPDDLVMQGFYYAGYADCIRCFYCGVGLKSWRLSDDVMVEHIWWRPSCGYLLNTKGRQFVEGVSRRLQDERSGEVLPSAPDGAETAAEAGVASDGDIDDGVDLGEEEMRQLEGMGFTPSLVDSALQHLQQSGGSATDVDTVVEAIMELQSGDSTAASNSNDNSQQAAGAEESVHADGASHESPAGQVRDDAERIRAENQRLKAKKTCRVCHTATVGMIFLPCGHLVTCVGCGTQARQCLMCRQAIRATANVFLT